MKLINRILTLTALTSGLYLSSCEEVELGEPNIKTTASSSSANFLLVNASPDAPALNLVVNNSKTGASVATGTGQDVYTKVGITSNAVLANTNIRAAAASGSIGGLLGSNDLIFRAGNNNANNLTAADSAYYTVIVLDSISRPKPLRTLNAKNFGDTTFFNPLTGGQISTVERKALSPEVRAKLVALGTVPLGASDPGGIRFLVITDQLPLPSTTRFPKPATGKIAVRFIHASPNSEDNVTVKVGATTVSNNGSIRSYPTKFPTFTPSVGSRSVTQGNWQTADMGLMTVTVTAGATEIANREFQFEDKGVYTIVMSGNRRALPLSLTIIKNK